MKETAKTAKLLIKKSDVEKRLIEKGKEKGYLTYQEVNDIIPEDVISPEEIDNLLTKLDEMDINIVDTPKEEKVADLHLTASSDIAIDDPIRLYLRSMGQISILTREQELAYAEEIEKAEEEIDKILFESSAILEKFKIMALQVINSEKGIPDLLNIDAEGEISKKVIKKYKKILRDSLRKIKQEEEKTIHINKLLSKKSLSDRRRAEFMKEVYKDKEPEPFTRPPNIKTVKIDPDTGLIYTPKCKKWLDEVFIAGTEPTEKCNKHDNIEALGQ